MGGETYTSKNNDLKEGEPMIRILTDSAADLTPRDAEQEGVVIVPLNVLFEGGEPMQDGVEITGEAFYERLAAEAKLPRTSQPSPEAFLHEFEDARRAGDTVIGVLLASSLSGTYQSACMAAAECGYEDIYLVDSGTGSQGEAILVREALRLRAEGYSPELIAAELEDLKARVRIVAVVDSLKHLHKGGRLPGAVALVGGALGVKPVLGLVDGEIKLLDKARGRPGAMVALFKQIEKLGGVDPRYGYAVLYSDDKQAAAPIHRYLHNNLGLRGGRAAQLGAVIGAHVGPGAGALAFVVPKE